jgi:hypothetical protein
VVFVLVLTDPRKMSKGNLSGVARGSAAPDGVEAAAAPADDDGRRMFSGYGVASAALGLVSVAAVVAGALIYFAHRHDEHQLSTQVRTAQAAVNWTGVLINMNKDNAQASLQTLRDGTIGELKNDFDAVMRPYRDAAATVPSASSGQIKSVSIESERHNADAPPPSPPTTPSDAGLVPGTDTVLITATSAGQPVGGQPQSTQWNLRIGVSDVGGKLLVSRLEPIR